MISKAEWGQMEKVVKSGEKIYYLPSVIEVGHYANSTRFRLCVVVS